MRWVITRWQEYLNGLMEIKLFSPAHQRVILGFILFSCFIIRIVTIESAPIDRTCWKEIDYLMISKNYFHHGFNLLKPEIWWTAEPPRITAMEFPIIPFAAGLLYAMFGFSALTARFIPLLSYIVFSLYLFKLVKREIGPFIGILAALAASIIPLYHFFGNILFSEPPMIALSVIALYHFAQWMDYKRRWDWIISMAAFSLAVAIKLEPLYLLLPLFWIAFRKNKFDIKKYGGFFLLAGCALVLPIIWFSYAYYLTIHSIDVFGIFKGHNKLQSFTMLSNIAWYKTMFSRIGGDILGGKFGSMLFVLGVISMSVIKKTNLFFVYLFTIGCYFCLVAEGNIDAPYRQLHGIASFSFFIAAGSLFVVFILFTVVPASWRQLKPLFQSIPVALTMCVCLLMIGPLRKMNIIFNANPFSHTDMLRWNLSRIIKNHAKPGTKIISAGEYTIHKGGNDLSPLIYYYSGFQGWTIQRPQWNIDTVNKLIDKGATIFAATRMSREPDAAPFLRQMRLRYSVMLDDSINELLLLDLKAQNKFEKQITKLRQTAGISSDKKT
jgi:hypothetical protein